MFYVAGKPQFADEKPLKIPWNSEFLHKIQASGDYTAELKLDDHRGFLSIGKDGKIDFWSRRGSKVSLDKEILDNLKQMSLPKGLVLDGGLFKRKEFGSRLWLFDILIIKGNKILDVFEKRRKLLENIVIPTNYIWVPEQTNTFIPEFSDILKKKSSLIQNSSIKYGFDCKLLEKFIEGLVIKKLDGKLSYPWVTKETSNFFKLRKADCTTSSKQMILKSVSY